MFIPTSDNLHMNLSWPISPFMLLASLSRRSCFELHLVSFYSQLFPRLLLIHTHTNSDFWFSPTRLPWCSCPVFVNMCGNLYWLVLQNSGRSALLVTAEIFQRNSLHTPQQVLGCPALLPGNPEEPEKWCTLFRCISH